MDDLEVEVLEHSAHRHSGIIDQDVDAAEPCDGRIDEVAAVVLDRYVRTDAQYPVRIRRHLRGKSAHLLERPRCHHDTRSVRAEQFGGSQPDTRAGSRNDYNFVLEVCGIHAIRRSWRPRRLRRTLRRQA